MSRTRGNTRDRKTELKAALVTILIVGIAYAAYALTHSVRASSLVGHGLGVVGFVLMLATETLYSIRKRWGRARWGRVSRWLSSHIYMGIVGPYLVLLHTAWRFKGLAGLTMLFTIIVVLSGFIGRYIYTSVHQGLAESELREADLEAELADLNERLQAWSATQPAAVQQVIGRDVALQPALALGSGAGAVLAQALDNWLYRWRLRQLLRQLPVEERGQLEQLRQLLARRRQLARQSATLAQARRLMSTWHIVHIPLGMVLFTAAFLHVIFALYYSTLSF
ncbi:MAG: hypothetical protein D6791_04960 [Chloroflexi bacterium]|nr:MAG: hypothetical protein D6791_04960 [Chloroflexota bacterium]